MVARVGAGATRDEAYQHGRNVMQLQRFVRQAIEERRLKPGTDLISLLVHARSDDPDRSAAEHRELMSISTRGHCRRGGHHPQRDRLCALHLGDPAGSVGATARDPTNRIRTSDASMKKCCDYIRRYLSCRESPGRKPCWAARPSRKALSFCCAGPPAIAIRSVSLIRTNSIWTDPTPTSIWPWAPAFTSASGSMLARQEMKCAIRENRELRAIVGAGGAGGPGRSEHQHDHSSRLEEPARTVSSYLTADSFPATVHPQ